MLYLGNSSPTLASSFIFQDLVGAVKLKFCLWPSSTLVTEILLELVHVLTEESKQEAWEQGFPCVKSLLVSSPDSILSRGKMVWWTKSNFLGSPLWLRNLAMFNLYHFLGISPSNSASFTRTFLGGRRTHTEHETKSILPQNMRMSRWPELARSF